MFSGEQLYVKKKREREIIKSAGENWDLNHFPFIEVKPEHLDRNDPPL